LAVVDKNSEKFDENKRSKLIRHAVILPVKPHTEKGHQSRTTDKLQLACASGLLPVRYCSTI
jgi:hypothetical protein